MKRITRYFVALVLSLSMSETVSAQVQSYKELHEVKRKETIFGIARENNITIEELIKANPEMNTPGYELKKGSFIRIPFPSNSQNSQNSAASSTSQNVVASSVSAAKPMDKDDVRQRAIRLGVMLPLHDQNGDGKRMVEYYRGVLMACDSLKTKGISVDVCAWNVKRGTLAGVARRKAMPTAPLMTPMTNVATIDIL